MGTQPLTSIAPCSLAREPDRLHRMNEARTLAGSKVDKPQADEVCRSVRLSVPKADH